MGYLDRNGIKLSNPLSPGQYNAIDKQTIYHPGSQTTKEHNYRLENTLLSSLEGINEVINAQKLSNQQDLDA